MRWGSIIKPGEYLLLKPMGFVLLTSTLLIATTCLQLAHAQIGQKMKTADGNNLQGTWRNTTMGFQLDLQLDAGGKGAFDGEAITYNFTNGQLVVKSNGVTNTYTCKLVGNSMTLSGGDLDAPVTFVRVGAISPDTPSRNNPGIAAPAPSSAQAITGTWVAANEEISFTPTGQFVYNGIPLNYTLQGNKIVVSAPAGNIVFEYAIQGQQLTLKGDGLNAVYARKAGAGNGPTGNSAAAPNAPVAGDGIIDPAMVGKWAYIGTANNLSGSFSTEEYITLHPDGTYEYYSESSGSARGSDMYGNQTYAGGTASQNADRGTWRVKGNTIIANSQRTGVKVYQLEKKNHPKNGDPMIILDGTAYVTYYQKAPWR